MKFEDWFHELEGFGLRSERFFIEECNSDGVLYDRMKIWLRAAFAAGQTESNMINDIEGWDSDER